MASDLIYREDAKVFVRHACYKKINPIDYLDEVPAADVVPWEWLERYADYFCAGVSMPEFVREAKMFYEGTNEAMKGGVIDG